MNHHRHPTAYGYSLVALALAYVTPTIAQPAEPPTDLEVAALSGPVRSVTERTFGAEYQMGVYVPNDDEVEAEAARVVYTAAGRFDTIFRCDIEAVYGGGRGGDSTAVRPDAAWPPLTWTVLMYDERGRLSAWRDASGPEARLRYRADSAVTVDVATGEVLSRARVDAAGRVVADRSVYASGAVNDYTTVYEASGRPSSTRLYYADGQGTVRTDIVHAHTYDSLGRAAATVSVDATGADGRTDTTLTTYRYTAHDSLGNWTVRLQTGRGVPARCTYRVIEYRGGGYPLDIRALSGAWVSPDGGRGLWFGGDPGFEPRQYPPNAPFAQVPDYEHPRRVGDYVYAVGGVRYSRGVAIATAPDQFTFLSEAAQPPRTFDVEWAGPAGAPTSMRLVPADGQGEVLEWRPVTRNED